MRKCLLIALPIVLTFGYAFGNSYDDQVKEISDKAVENCKTFEEKIQAIKIYILDKIKVTPQPNEGKALSEKQIAILEKYYSIAGLIREKGNIFTSSDYYKYLNPIRLIMNRNVIDKLDFGYGWCDDTARIFMDLAQKQGITTEMVYLFSSRNPPHEQHTVAEALSPNGKWVIVDLDPKHALQLYDAGKMFSRLDIANNINILRNDPIRMKFVETEPGTWGQHDYIDMFYNEYGQIKFLSIGEERTAVDRE